MKKKINFDILKHCKQTTLNKQPNYPLTELYKLSYDLISQIITDVKRPFTKICIHGHQPHHIMPFLQQHNKVRTTTNSDPPPIDLTIIDYMEGYWTAEKINQLPMKVKEVRYVDNPDLWIGEQDHFDLIISCLELHHAANDQEMLKKYLRSLKPDGVLSGAAFGEGNLGQLNWSYLMAENERSGGISPKVKSFPSLGIIGNSITAAEFKLATVLGADYQLQFQSVIDLLQTIQFIGEGAYLKGRRKGVYKDVLLAMAALYTSQFNANASDNTNTNTNPSDSTAIRCSLNLSRFIGWKYDPSQQKALKRGKQVGGVQFSQQLRKFDTQLKEYIITEGKDDPQEVKRK